MSPRSVLTPPRRTLLQARCSRLRKALGHRQFPGRPHCQRMRRTNVMREARGIALTPRAGTVMSAPGLAGLRRSPPQCSQARFSWIASPKTPCTWNRLAEGRGAVACLPPLRLGAREARARKGASQLPLLVLVVLPTVVPALYLADRTFIGLRRSRPGT